MQMDEQVRVFWQQFQASAGDDVSERVYEVFHFDDNESAADELAALVLAGVKRATAGLAWSCEAAGQPAPKPGDLSVVTDWRGKPLCIIETTAVEIVPFEEVTGEFAAIEGEGDRSLRCWREGHWDFFGRECARIGRRPDVRMPVICERFQVVYRRSAE